jgi:hypothetical protein
MDRRPTAGSRTGPRGQVSLEPDPVWVELVDQVQASSMGSPDFTITALTPEIVRRRRRSRRSEAPEMLRHSPLIVLP